MDQTVLNKSDMFISKGKVLLSLALDSSQFQWRKEDAENQRHVKLCQRDKWSLSEAICVEQARLHLYEVAGGPDKGCFIMVWGII